MSQYIRKRIALAIPTILLASVVVFLMLYLLPGDPASIYIGDSQATPQRIAAVRRAMGFDRPLYVQYGDFLWRAVRGDLGRSIQTNLPVTQEILDRLPDTFTLAVAAMLLAVLFGVSLGMISGLKQNSWIDTLAMVGALTGVSIPVFWLGILLIMLFAVRLQWFPATSGPGLRGLVLPAVSLALLSTGTLARLVRASIIEVLQQEFLQTARAKGLRERTSILRHAMPNALIPVVTMMGLQFGDLLSGAVVTETVFARPGLGALVVNSIQNKDVPVVQGVILVLASMYVLVNLLVDLSYAYIDPRIRLQ